MNRGRAGLGAVLLVSVMLTSVGGVVVGCLCSDEEQIPIEDGSYRERPASPPGPSPRLREVSATIEDGEMTIQYVQGTDGRTYVVRLRERD